MSRRSPDTLADYVIVGIIPALIMLLVGSFTFLLITASYQGDFSWRLKWISGLFVFAAVLIGRISIDEGREYASLYAIALGLVVMLAMQKFVDAPLIVNFLLVAVIWFCSDKLTWDCTVIDESEEPPAEGLLQTVGIGHPETDVSVEDELRARGSQEESDAAPSGPLHERLWKRWVEHRRRPHTPGVWVIYFCMFSLPLFGLSQWFIDSEDLASRRHAFHLVCVYVASALGLLMTTSFLSIRRYLRQRQLQMPMEMTGAWLGVGTCLIAAILIAAVILPRPSPEYSITDWPIFAGAPEHDQTSQYAIGNEGIYEDRANRPGSSDAPTSNSPSRNEADNSNPSGGTAGEPSGNSRSGGSQSGGSQSGGSQSGGSQSGGSQSGGSQSGGSESNNTRTDSQSDGSAGQDASNDSGNRRQSGDSGSRPSQNSRRSDESTSSSSDSDGGNEPQSPGGQRGEPRTESSSAGRNEQNQSPNQSPNQDASQSQDASQDPGRSEPRTNTENAGSSSPPPEPTSPEQPTNSWSVGRMLASLGGGFGLLLKVLYWLIVLAIVAFVLWRYGSQIWAAVQQFIADVRKFLAQLWGRDPGDEGTVLEEASAPAAPPRPFTSFRSPFASANGMPLDEAIRHSFHALEAWAREHDCPRGVEQTPHEFARQVAARDPALAAEVRDLADLYAQLSYSGDSVAVDAEPKLRRFWERITSPASTPEEVRG